ncbi:hypothetical protein SKAU_G00300610 [Synaphobranchus kaupii]|uniref:Uncharacterized protein n=1 Tax=Synaphobranchus kaupii TaxID=118154 RepID=A0A9Q1IN80_SYNKA|nr:hypothetical protein SKAU_G00300610 [Synaphobranchus kaupii]
MHTGSAGLAAVGWGPCILPFFMQLAPGGPWPPACPSKERRSFFRPITSHGRDQCALYIPILTAVRAWLHFPPGQGRSQRAGGCGWSPWSNRYVISWQGRTHLDQNLHGPRAAPQSVTCTTRLAENGPSHNAVRETDLTGPCRCNRPSALYPPNGISTAPLFPQVPPAAARKCAWTGSRSCPICPSPRCRENGVFPSRSGLVPPAAPCLRGTLCPSLPAPPSIIPIAQTQATLIPSSLLCTRLLTWTGLT